MSRLHVFFLSKPIESAVYFTVIFLSFLALECLALLAKLKITYWNTLLKYKENKITVHLAEEYLGEHLISRSIARRILSNIEKFKVIFLDFNGVKTIGQAFADEIFRVFRNKHKEITILPINMNEEVKFMIKRVDKNMVIE